MQTAKSVQLTTTEGVNISPTTDLMSVYYEVQTNDGVIARKYIYNDFPVGVSYVNVSLNNLTVSNDTHQYMHIGNNQKIQYIDNDGHPYDIIVSDISVQKLSGTNYNVIHSNNYNLSEILYNYESKYAFDISINECSVYANKLAKDNYVFFNNQYSVIQKDIYNISTDCQILTDDVLGLSNQVNNALLTYNDSNIYTVSELQNLCTTQSLIANKIYPVYYCPQTSNINISSTSWSQQNIRLNNVCMTTPTAQFQKFILYLKARTVSTFYSEVQLISGVTISNNVIDLQWQIKYDLFKNTITWMKDEYNNEAPYDFKHTIFDVDVNRQNCSLYTFSEYDSINDTYIEKTTANAQNVYNNKIIQNNYPTILCASDKIYNNDIDTNAIIYIDAYMIEYVTLCNSIFVWVCHNTGGKITTEIVSYLTMYGSNLVYNALTAHTVQNYSRIQYTNIYNTIIQISNNIQVTISLVICDLQFAMIDVSQSGTYELKNAIIYCASIILDDQYPIIHNTIVQNMSASGTTRFTLTESNAYYADVSMYAKDFIALP